MNDERIEQCKKDIESLNKELTKLIKEKDEGNIPQRVRCGDVFSVYHNTVMVAYVGEGKVGLTCLTGSSTGCWNSAILDGPVKDTCKIREVLVQKKAKYLGRFENLFTRNPKDTK